MKRYYESELYFVNLEAADASLFMGKRACRHMEVEFNDGRVSRVNLPEMNRYILRDERKLKND